MAQLRRSNHVEQTTGEMAVESENGTDQEQENETQIDAVSPSSSVELSENGAHPCPMCPSVFTSSHELTNHLRGHNSPRSTDCSGEEDYSCGVCSKVLSSASSLDRHVLVHSGERPFKCKYCEMSFTTNGNMNRHVRCTHRMASPNSCTDSEGSSGSERPATTNPGEYNNNELARRGSPSLIDERQQASSPGSHRASKRKLQEEEDAGDTEEQKRHKTLMNNGTMMIRVQRNGGEMTFECLICGKDFVTEAMLDAHVERAHPKSLATCEICNTSFKSHRQLNHHRFTSHCKKNAGGSNSRRSIVDGFNDLTHLEFSSPNFPMIARRVCEQELHLASGEVQFQCMKCLHAFPCKQAQLDHEKECKGSCKSKRNSNDSNNNNDNNTNNNLEMELDAPSPLPDDPKTTREIFFAVLDLQNKSSLARGEAKEPRELKEIKEPKEMKDLADIPSILSVSLNGLPTFPRSDTSTPENNIKFNPNIGSSGSSGTCSSEFNEEEAQDAFTAEFRKMKLKGEFPCRLCTSVFPNLRALKGHNRAHMNVEPGMPYPCNMCPFTSTDKGALLKHLRSHNGDRPFECSLCNYAFTTKANCERHVKNRHGMISKEDVKNALIYHPSEDSTNENVERSSPRGIRDDVRKSLVYPNEREEISQQIHYPPVSMDCNPGPSNVCAEMLMNRYEKSDMFHRPTKALNLVKRNGEELNVSQDLIIKSNYSKIDEDAESRSSDGSVSLVSDTKTDTHQRIQASPMNLTKSTTSSVLSSGEDAPLDLSMDVVLDLSRKQKKENENSQEEKHFKNQQELYAASPALLLTQALLNTARENPPSLENLYASTLYRNLAGASMIPPYFLNPHMFSQELAEKGRLQKELVRGLQLTGGSTLPVDPSLPSTSYAAFAQARDTPPTSSEHNTYASLMNAQIASQAASSREKTDNISSNDPVKMVLKNGVLIPKQKQRRYRTERPFGCEHCTARFTLRSNMERHIKQQHPQYWSQRPRGGHSTRGRPPANHSTIMQNPGPSTSQITQSYPNILPNVDSSMVTSADYNTHPISDQVKYAILAQQLKADKMDDNDSDDEMVIDEESGDRDGQEPQAQHELRTSLLRDQLESNESNVKDVVVKKEVIEPAEDDTSEESHDEQTAQNGVDRTSAEESTAAENKSTRTEDMKIKMEPTGKEQQSKLEDGAADLASVSKLLDNASQQYQQFQPQYLSDEEGPVASTSGNNSGSEKSDSNSLNSGNDSSSNKKKKKKKKSAYSMAPNRVPCPFCPRQFPWSSSLRRHILTHTGQKPFQCMHCSHHFTTKSNCDRHLLRKHKAKANKMRRARNSSSPDVQVVASSSSSSSNNTFSMRNVPERPYKCNQCPSSTFSTLGNLKKHRSTKHRKAMSRSESSDQQNSPPQCSNTQNDQSDYESRSSSASENMENSAGATAKANSNMTSSMNETARSRKSPRSSPGPSDVPFKCYLCDSGFSERQDNLDHIKMHHKRSYDMLKAKGALDMATMNIDASEDQMAHQHLSDGEEKRGRFPDYSNRKVVCAFCMRRFWSAEDLRRHMRTHTGERPFECDICTRKFTLKHSMLRHRKKHESVDSAMYIGNSGDEDNPPSQPPTITPKSQQHSPISTNTSRPRTQDRISLPTVAAVATADAAPCALMRYNHYDNMATTLTGRMANDGSQSTGSASILSPPPPAEIPSESGDNDLISNLLGIREKGLLDKVLLSSADDAAKLLGVKHSE
ncbi:ras-responsive element-binding protein 1 isoform X2 [Nylanderia fulva]|uniref:ras-responsive element-binding protein 1 isoform X2 n=1 Tax=Nylanderia fulva TaxID=613905 RepID=UPI0010FAFDF3|nr:ras-responsive element-binding protein 1 isoform X2 [Nylanderia fulva]